MLPLSRLAPLWLALTLAPPLGAAGPDDALRAADPASPAPAVSLPLPSPQRVDAPESPADLERARAVWREANRSVADFPRGHIDLLRWEAAQPQAAAPAAAAAVATAAVAAAPVVAGRVERAIVRPTKKLKAGDPGKETPGELATDFVGEPIAGFAIERARIAGDTLDQRGQASGGVGRHGAIVARRRSRAPCGIG